MTKEKATEARTDGVQMHEGPVPEFGQKVFQREIPSDSAVVTALVVRALEFLRKESMILPEDETRIGLCLEEALQNAVIHGNRRVFQKKARTRGSVLKLCCLREPIHELFEMMRLDKIFEVYPNAKDALDSFVAPGEAAATPPRPLAGAVGAAPGP